MRSFLRNLADAVPIRSRFHDSFRHQKRNESSSINHLGISRDPLSLAILVLHGGSPERAERTAIVLKNLLAKLHDRGYQVVTLSQLVDHKRY
jgi:hypothetical protein